MQAHSSSQIAHGYELPLKTLNPVAPFITEELWQHLGHDNTIAYESWPCYDDSKLKEDSKVLAVQVNGKLRGTITIPLDLDDEKIKEEAINNINVKKYLEGNEIIKIIVVKNKIVNIVVKQYLLFFLFLL